MATMLAVFSAAWASVHLIASESRTSLSRSSRLAGSAEGCTNDGRTDTALVARIQWIDVVFVVIGVIVLLMLTMELWMRHFGPE